MIVNFESDEGVLEFILGRKYHRQIKPYIKYAVKSGESVYSLLDTGAHVPIWSKSKESFIKAFPDAVDTKMKFRLGGFGGDDNTDIPVYRIPYFVMINKGASLTIRGLYVACDFDGGHGNCDLILSYTMFNEMDLLFYNTDANEKILKIIFKRNFGTYAIPVKDKEGNDTDYLQGIDTYTLDMQEGEAYGQ